MNKLNTPAIVERAMEVFVQGFCFTRSFTHPYVAERVGPAWVVRDGPRTRGDARNEEWIAHGLSPDAWDRLVKRHARGRFAICAICGAGEADEPLRSGLKACGYRFGRTEALMVHPLRRIPKVVAPVAIERVLTETMAERLFRAARTRQVPPEHLTRDAPLRAYVATVDDQVVGWVRSIVVGDATWCSSMYVAPAFRRRGIGRALLNVMLRDDRAAGARHSVLLASHAGAKLYSAVGFETIGTLLLFTPVKSRR
jgi:GNAT superfamily N-acetyltransferase